MHGGLAPAANSNNHALPPGVADSIGAQLMKLSHLRNQSVNLSRGAVVALVAALTACGGGGGSGSSGGSGNRGTELRSAQFVVNQSLGSVSFAGGNSLNLSLSPGAGAFHVGDDDRDVFYTVTDRGPTIPCSETAEVIGVANFCSSNGSVFALPDFAPRILRWKLDESGNNLTLSLEETITLRDSFRNPAGGLPNGLQSAADERAFDNSGNDLGTNPNGIDPSALVRLDNGKFWVAEEYGPSLLLVDTDGEILQRQVPQGIRDDLEFSTYDVREDVLPGILARRKLHNGISALALSPNNDFLYFIMRAPLNKANGQAADGARIVRIGKVSLNSDGSANALEGEYLYRLDSASQFGVKASGQGDLDGDNFVDQSEVTINEAAALDEDYLLVVEQADTVSKVYRIDLSDAVSIQGSEFDSPSTSPSLEERAALVDYPFVVKQPVFNSMVNALASGLSALGPRIEGMALLSSDFAVLTNDHQYGIRGGNAKMVLVPLVSLTRGLPRPSSVQLSYEDSGLIESGAGFDAGGADAVATDSATARGFVANNAAARVDVFNLTSPLSPSLSSQINVADAAAGLGLTAGKITDVAVRGSFLVVSVANADLQANGLVAFYDLTTLGIQGSFQVGAGPKSLLFDPTADRLFVANEGAPNSGYNIDPEGSVSVIDFRAGVADATVETIDFLDFNSDGSRAAEVPAGLILSGPGASVAQDLEPDQLAISQTGAELYVSLSENNAVAVIEIATLTVESILALGNKDFGEAVAGLDTNNNGSVEILPRPGVVGLYQPAGVAGYRFGSNDFIVTANTGAPRQYSGFNEVVPAEDLDGFNGPNIDSDNPSIFAASSRQEIGALQVSRETGDTDGDGDIDLISAFGGRSFSIWDAQGNLVYDSGDDFARITAAFHGADFNDRDQASVGLGAKAKKVSLITTGAQIYALITLENSGGIMVYNVTSPYGVQFVQYLNNRNFASDPQFDTGDVGADEIALFTTSTTAYILVSNRRSGTVRVFELSTTASS